MEDRFVHIDEISDNRLGEDEDILQIQVNLFYSNKTQHLINALNNTAEVAGDIEVDFENNDTGDKSEKRLVQPNMTFEED